MKCFNCKTNIPDHSSFCPSCGRPQGFSADLINRATSGDQSAISELYQKTWPRTYTVVKNIVKDEDASQDITQDSYLKAFQNLDAVDKPAGFQAWINTIARNRAIDYLRKTKPVLFSVMVNEEGQVIDFEDDRTDTRPDLITDRNETSRLIGEILETLPEDQRACISMFYYEEMSIREIADSLSLSENTVKSRLNYGKKKIRFKVEALEKQGTKLYGFGGATAVPLIVWLLRSREAQAAQAVPQFVPKFAGHAAAASSAAGKSAALTGTASGTKDAAASTDAFGTKAGGTAAASAAGKALGIKAAAIIAAAAVGGGAAGYGVRHYQATAAQQEAVVSSSTPGTGQSSSSSGSSQSENTPQITESAEQPAVMSPAVTPSPSAAPDPQAARAAYDVILQEYRDVLSGRAEQTAPPYEDDVCYAAGLTPYSESPWGYTYYDIDGNGTEEMIVAIVNQHYSEEAYWILGNVYAFDGTRAKTVFRGGERYPFFIGSDGMLVQRGSISGYESAVIVYDYEEGADLYGSEYAHYDYNGFEDEDHWTGTDGSVLTMDEMTQYLDNYPKTDLAYTTLDV